VQEITGGYVNALFNANKQDYVANHRLRRLKAQNCDALLGTGRPLDVKTQPQPQVNDKGYHLEFCGNIFTMRGSFKAEAGLFRAFLHSGLLSWTLSDKSPKTCLPAALRASVIFFR
jgi:hypothetical protein